MTGLTMVGADAAACEGDACLLPAPQGGTRAHATASAEASTPDPEASTPDPEASTRAEEAATPPR